ncbi:MAG TPA: ATP-binding protein [Polyangiaceae bacterium]
MTAWAQSGTLALDPTTRARDEVEDDLSRALDRVLKVAAGVVFLSAVVAPFSAAHYGPTLVLHALFALFLGTSYLLLHSGRRRTAGALLAGGFWIVSTGSVFAFGGVHSPGTFVYLPVVATAGLFWSRRAATVLAIASAFSVLFAAQLEALGALPTPLAPVPPERLWTVFTGSLLMTAVLSLSAIRRLASVRRDLVQSRALLEDLASAQARAEQERSELEQRLRSVERLESVGRLAGGVAHDFNNLLSIILNSASVLRRELPPGTFEAELVGEIDEATKRATTLVKRLLVSSGRNPVVPKLVDLNQVVRGISTILRRLGGPGYDIVVEPKAERAGVLCDVSELEQVILNLALNARDAMPRGGRLAVETKNEGSSALLIVTDEGVGMDKATVGRIFEPFFTTKGSAGGTGLGLASVKRIVDNAGGEIAVRSEPGNGTRFEIRLPLVVASPS